MPCVRIQESWIRTIPTRVGKAKILLVFRQLESGAGLAYLCIMKSVEEIEAEIARLNPVEVRQLSTWIAKYKAELWDKQIEEDADAGKLDRYIAETLEEYVKGKTRPLS
jgi:hypothetical protein